MNEQLELLSIASARHPIDITNACCIPDDLSVEMLVAARQRGVRVRILDPWEHTDCEIVRGAFRERSDRQLGAGAEVQE
ncbi:MAG: hypothetical protein ABI910_21635 [Gemmatimonadota bacterium]